MRVQHARTHYDTLQGVDEYDLSQIYHMLPEGELARMADNIVDALDAIQNRLGDEDGPFDLYEWDAAGSLTLVPLPDEGKRSLLPETHILDQLFPVD
mmetsp:Transcript_50392/g.99550  ORF Transcript_50392/g.99550 Transcript_50392/m.99550 type:complete len:97 (+) Transcript_50392:1-291(+)